MPTSDLKGFCEDFGWAERQCLSHGNRSVLAPEGLQIQSLYFFYSLYYRLMTLNINFMLTASQIYISNLDLSAELQIHQTNCETCQIWMSHRHLKLDRSKAELLTPCPDLLYSFSPLVVQLKQNHELLLDSSLSLIH